MEAAQGSKPESEGRKMEGLLAPRPPSVQFQVTGSA